MVLNTEWTVPKLSWRTVGVKVGCTAAIVKLWILVSEHMGFVYAEEEKMNLDGEILVDLILGTLKG